MQCEPFIYGGCLGNENRFLTEEECLAACKPKIQHYANVGLPERQVDSKLHVEHRVPKDHVRGHNQHDVPANDKPIPQPIFYERHFETNLEHKDGKYAKAHFTSKIRMARASADQDVDHHVFKTKNVNTCWLEPDPGKCMAYMPRYYWDPSLMECEKFVYGGCGGNSNNFKTKEECESTCKPYIDHRGNRVVPSSAAAATCSIILLSVTASFWF